MKVTPKVLALMAAMAVGVAGAQTTTSNPSTSVTPAGQEITNMASATYTDPSNPTSTLTSTSNTVTTVVLPKPSFDITYGDGKTDGSGNPSNPANSVSANTPDQAIVAPGATATNTYTVQNTGNVPLTIDLTTTTFGTGTTAIITSDAAGKTPITTITVPANSTATIYTQTTIPANAKPSATPDYGSTPVGTVTGTGTTSTQNGIAAGSTLQENQTVDTAGVPSATPAAGTDLQYLAITPTNASLNNNPSEPGGNPVTSTVTPPGTTTPVPGYNGGTTPPVTPPGGGTVTGTTPITIVGDTQTAYPPADGNTTPDTVIFTNTVGNGSATPDTVTLTPGPLPVGTTLTPGTTTVTDTNGVTWTYAGTGTWTNPAGDTVQFINPATGTLTDTVTVPANGTANYITQVTYPDSNPNAGTTTLDAPKPVTVIITTTSGNNPNVSDTTTDTVYPAAATFGDTPAQTGTGATAVEDPSKAYYPGGTLAATTTTPGAPATFPMSIANTGQYADTYTVTGYVVIPLNDGTSATVPVVYSGAGVTQTGTTTVNGVSVPVYTTTPVAAGTTTSGLTATVTVPNNALATGTGTAPTLQQTATGVGSTIVMKDLNDPLPIAPAGNIVVGKFTQTKDGTPAANTQYAYGNPATVSTTAPGGTTPYVQNPAGYDGSAGANPNTSYQPGTKYNYQIIAKNSYNTDIAGFTLTDPLNSALNFVSGTCTIVDKSGINVSTAAATLDTATNTVNCTATTLPQGGTANLTIVVNVK